MSTSLLDGNWLQNETPLGIPLFTPFIVRTWSENCWFALDAQIVRMVYFGGLSTNDSLLLAWTLYASGGSRGAQSQSPWLASERIAKSLGSHLTQSLDSNSDEDVTWEASKSIAFIQDVSGFSRRQLTDWLDTSHTTLNGIVAQGRMPRASLATRIESLFKLMLRLQRLNIPEGARMRQALTTPSLNGKSARDYVVKGDYASATTATELALERRL